MEIFNVHYVVIVFLTLALCFFGRSSTDSVPTSNAIIDHNSCLTPPDDNGTLFVYLHTTCVCRMTESLTVFMPEWFDKSTGETLSTGQGYATLQVDSNLRVKERSVVCRGRERDRIGVETPLPQISDSKRDVKITFDTGQGYTDQFVTSVACPEEVFFTCSTPERDVFQEVFGRASLTIYDENENADVFTLDSFQSKTENQQFYFDFRLILITPGHVFLRCDVSISTKGKILSTGLRDFHVIEKPITPLITKINNLSSPPASSSNIITEEKKESLNLVCTVPDPWSDRKVYLVEFECGMDKNGSRKRMTSLQIDVHKDLNQTVCRCSVKYGGCSGKWIVETVIHVHDKIDPVTSRIATLVDTTFPTNGDTVDPTVIHETVAISELKTTTTKDPFRPVDKSGIISTGDSGSNDDKDDDDDDDGKSHNIIIGMSVGIILAAVVFCIIGFIVGSRKKKKVSMDHEQPRVALKSFPALMDNTNKKPVEDAYAENINMVGLEPDLINSSTKLGLGNLDPKKQTQQEQQRKLNTLEEDQNDYANPVTAVPNVDTKPAQKSSGKRCGKSNKIPAGKDRDKYSKVKKSKKKYANKESNSQQRMQVSETEENFYSVPTNNQYCVTGIHSSDQMTKEDKNTIPQHKVTYRGSQVGSDAPYEICRYGSEVSYEVPSNIPVADVHYKVPVQSIDRKNKPGEDVQDKLQVSDEKSFAENNVYECQDFDTDQSAIGDDVYQNVSHGIYEKPSNWD